MTERWLPIPDVPGYMVSDEGRVQSPRKILKPYRNQNGYFIVMLRDSAGKRGWRGVHRLVLLAFVGEPPPGTECCHGNGVRDDNRLENLRWGTKSENSLDAVAHGTHNHVRKTHCPAGHPYSPENTYILRGNRRQCVICTKARAAATRQRKKAAA